jgi:hypothetical protein
LRLYVIACGLLWLAIAAVGVVVEMGSDVAGTASGALWLH